MDADRIKGKVKDFVGHGKEEVGERRGDRDLEAEGRADQAEGHTQETKGKVEDKVRDVVRDITR